MAIELQKANKGVHEVAFDLLRGLSSSKSTNALVVNKTKKADDDNLLKKGAMTEMTTS